MEIADVGKLQKFTICQILPQARDDIDNVMVTGHAHLHPVSYTHLDVYKRQAYEYHEALSNGGFAGSVDGDGSVSGTLYHYSHVVLVFLRGQSYELIRCVHGSAG